MKRTRRAKYHDCQKPTLTEKAITNNCHNHDGAQENTGDTRRRDAAGNEERRHPEQAAQEIKRTLGTGGGDDPAAADARRRFNADVGEGVEERPGKPSIPSSGWRPTDEREAARLDELVAGVDADRKGAKADET